jgi:hypothetical protein
MKILLVEPDYEVKFKNLGLMRISSMLKAQGNSVEYIKGLKKFNYTPDEIWVTSLFTYQYKEVLRAVRFYKKQFPKSKFKLGGILASTRPDLFKDEGVEIHIGVLPEAEKYAPDYSLFPDIDYSMCFISRGCVNQCGFCCVPKLEGKIWHRDNWLQDINLKFKKILFLDNNWLALDKETWLEDVRKLKELKKQGINEIDFNQSIDARLFDEDKAKALRGLPIRPIRFSFDHLGQDKKCQNAIKLAKKYKFNEVRVDILYNWIDTPEDFYYRIKEVCNLGASAIPMRYAPLDKVDREYLGKNWTLKERNAVQKINPYPKGEISSRTNEEFEYFFGKDAKEFKRLLNFDNITKLNELKMKKLCKDKIWERKLEPELEVKN